MKIIKDKIELTELKQMAEKMFGNLLKAVVDVEQGIMAVDAELHADLEAYLLENNSHQNDLWGINLYPDQVGDNWLEFDSMINLRPSQGNRSRGVEDLAIQQKIREIVNNLVKQ